jgi:hypothetical protein
LISLGSQHDRPDVFSVCHEAERGWDVLVSLNERINFPLAYLLTSSLPLCKAKLN